MRGFQSLGVPLGLPGACNRCNHQFPNLSEVGPEIAQYILDQHDQACAGINKRVEVAQQSAASGVGIVHKQFTTTPPLRPLQDTKIIQTPGPRKRKKYATDMMERKALLEADVWGREVTSKSIVCNGCDKKILLDQRNEYYPGLWMKHRSKCKSVLKRTGVEIPPRAPRRASARGNITGSFGQANGNATPIIRVANDARVSTEQVEVESSFYGRSISPVTVSSRTSSIEPMMSLPPEPVHKSRSEPVPFRRIGTGTPPEEREFDYTAGPARRSTSMTPFEDAETYNEVASASDRDCTPGSSVSAEGSHKRARAGSDSYWSEAPFDGGSGELGRGLYRHSTRWELVNVFPGMHQKHYKDDRSDEKVAPASPQPSI